MTEASSHMCVGPSCWTCGEPSELRHLRQQDVMPALAELLRQNPTADHHRLATEAMKALRPTLMRWLHAENLLRDVLNHADGTWSPPGWPRHDRRPDPPTPGDPPMTFVPSSELRDRIAAALAREDVNWGYDCGFSADLLRDDRTAAFVDAVLAVVQPELDRLRSELAAMTDLRDRAIARQDDLRADVERIRTRENGVRTERRQALRELEQARQQTEAAHCRLHHIQARVEQITDQDLAIGIGLDLMPWLDGPIHPDQLADYRAAMNSATPVEICEIPHATIEEEDACEQQRLAQAATAQPTT